MTLAGAARSKYKRYFRPFCRELFVLLTAVACKRIPCVQICRSCSSNSCPRPYALAQLSMTLRSVTKLQLELKD
uniref:Secreted protein n=1 Tax=Steinernema glaseri TaxID=37863 RepID=A0A1I7Z7U3_9BILA